MENRLRTRRFKAPDPDFARFQAASTSKPLDIKHIRFFLVFDPPTSPSPSPGEIRVKLITDTNQYQDPLDPPYLPWLGRIRQSTS